MDHTPPGPADRRGGTARRIRILVVGLLTVVQLAALSLVLVGCGSVPAPPRVSEDLLVPERFSASDAREENTGTWIVTQTHLSCVYPKVVIHPWGLVELFESPGGESYARRNTSITVQKWRDSAGNVWCKNFARFSMKGFYSGQAFYLTRLSADGQTLETIFGNVGWPDPSEMDPDSNTTYVKYRRVE